MFKEAGKEVEVSGNLHDYVVTALQSLWGAGRVAVVLQRRTRTAVSQTCLHSRRV